ncbi:MAG: response regulator [Chloroflexi bacterium]|nr:response regulator [Chloroflexota bacterium]MCI0577166.1 response regulator [Chloroflexota bacterium]MCI0649905.1 response regulator [Chloroflexota bacterium]MCI0725675.1 response regulator [Chloroflexota bacterium]
MKKKKSTTILMADDDLEIRLLIQEALAESQATNELRFVENGEELMDYLYHRGKYSELNVSPSPGLILLDLNMPKKGGREALQEIRADPKLRHISVVVLTTSQTEEDIYRSYKMGANSFIAKPRSFERLVHIMKNLAQYWFSIVELPAEPSVE